MRTFTLAFLAAAALATAASLPAYAAGAAQSSATPAQRAKKAKPAKTTAAAKKAKTTHRTQAVGKLPVGKVKKAEAETPVETPTERLTDAELALAPKVYTGTIACAQGEDVNVRADDKNPGFFRVDAGARHYYMHPVVSKTGAMRLEDNSRGAVWLQLGNKSMLLDQKLGQRVADDCESAAQKDYAAHMSQHPAVDLLGLDKK